MLYPAELRDPYYPRIADFHFSNSFGKIATKLSSVMTFGRRSNPTAEARGRICERFPAVSGDALARPPCFFIQIESVGGFDYRLAAQHLLAAAKLLKNFTMNAERVFLMPGSNQKKF